MSPLPIKTYTPESSLRNPAKLLREMIRDLLAGFTPEHLSAFLIVNAAMLLLLSLVWVVYRAAMPILIERMSA
jgi:lipopolysaccharide transport system permease protein